MNIGHSENATQKRIIDLFCSKLGYTYLGNLSGEDNLNIIKDRLKEFLKTQSYSNVLIENAITEFCKISENQNQNLYELNQNTYSLLRYGIKVGDPLTHKNKTVCFIDWKNPLKNNFYIAEEVSVKGIHDKRPDLVIYINGIALGVVELKRSTVSISEGIRQNITNQGKDMIMRFFATIGLIFAGNDSEGLRYATTGTPEKYYLSWREDADATDEVSIATRNLIEKENINLDKDFISMCKKERFVEILYNFIIFDSGVKKTCRPNQFFGVTASKDYIENNNDGIIWHTQGSGKSLTMVWLSKWIKENINDSRVLIITDRDELDLQIEQVFKGVEEKNITRIKSVEKLVKALNDPSPALMCSLVHKFRVGKGSQEEGDYTAGFAEKVKASLPQNFSPKGNIFVFVDECHRSQSGKFNKVMRGILPNSSFIGFTGTPLMKKDKEKSIEVFGPYIHRYKFHQAVKDKVVLDLRYEARDIDQDVVNQTQIDMWFESKTRGLNDTAKAKLKQRWGNLQKVFSSKERLVRIVSDIIFDMETKPRLHDGRGNAMLVASSIYQACKFYELFQSTPLKNKCAIVTSYEPNASDIRTESVGDDGETENAEKYKIYNEMLNGRDPSAFEQEVKDKFINQPEQMKLLIVVDKLLTGFDAPATTYLYIDKSMRDHGLFQAICRVNRLDGDDKDYGYIIDYKDLFHSLEQAVEDYTTEAFDNYDKEDVSGLLSNRLDKAKERLEQSLEAIKALCEEVAPPKEENDFIHYFCGKKTNGFDLEELKSNMPKREKLYRFSATILRAFGEVSSELSDKYNYSVEQIKSLEEDVSYYVNIAHLIKLASGDYIDLKAYDPDMRHLIDTYISASQSKLITDFGGTSLLELLFNEGLQALKDMPQDTPSQQEAVSETIENNIAKEIIEKRQSNPKYYEKMSELLQELIMERKKDASNYKEYLLKLIALAKQVYSPESSTYYPSSINTLAKRAFYDFLDKNEELAIDVYTAIIFSMQDRWRGNSVKERRIERALKNVLSDDSLVKEIFSIVKEQSEF